MEFEKDAPISDEQRRLAETKKVTLQPVHEGVTPDDISDSQIANSHINGQPIANTQNDTEQDAVVLLHADRVIQDNTSAAPRRQSLILITTIVGVASVLIVSSLLLILSITA